jgi:hypothetical protein
LRRTYNVDSGVQNGTDIRFLLQESPDHSVKAGGQLITDTENLAFIYLLDDTDGYTYVQFPKTVWPLLTVALGADKEPVLVWGENEITLTNFREELNTLIFNIEGNLNYGVEFSTAVEEAFKEQLTSD